MKRTMLNVNFKNQPQMSKGFRQMEMPRKKKKNEPEAVQRSDFETVMDEALGAENRVVGILAEARDSKYPRL